MNKIKFFRQQRGMTIRELSKKANIAVGYLSDLENSKSSNPTKEVMENISAALGQTVPNVFYPDKE